MRPTALTPLGPDTPTGHPVPLPHFAADPASSDIGLTSGSWHDGLSTAGLGWEHCWIDLGGEG